MNHQHPEAAEYEAAAPELERVNNPWTCRDCDAEFSQPRVPDGGEDCCPACWSIKIFRTHTAATCTCASCVEARAILENAR